MEQLDDKYFIDRVINGDADAFVYIVRNYERMIFTVVSRIVRRKDIAEDLTQDIFLKVYQSLTKYKGKSKFSTWLYTIAYNEALLYIRSNKKEAINYEVDYQDLSDSKASEELIEALELEQQLHYLKKAIGRLPSEDALLISLFYLDEHSIKEMSEITGLTESNLKVKLHRTRKVLYSEMTKMMKV